MTTPPTLPELTDTQVSRMYAAITAEVEVVESRRRRRRTVGLAAAALVAVVGVGSVVVPAWVDDSLSGEDASVSVEGPGSAGGRAERAPNDGLTEGGASVDGGVDGSMTGVPDAGDAGGVDEGAEGDGGNVTGAPDADAGREIVTTAYATVEVDTPSEAADDLVAWAEAAGGRLESRSERRTASPSRTTLLLRVPADRATDATDHLDDVGTVTDLEVSSDDVTSQGRDLDARISALSVSVDRLETLMSEATSTDDLLRAEEALSQRQSELDSLEAERRSLTDQVAMSSVQVELVQPDEKEAPSPSGFVGGLADGWGALLALSGAVVAVVGFVLPWALALALLAAAGLVVRRIRRRAA